MSTFLFGPHTVESAIDPNMDFPTARKIFNAIQRVARAGGKVGTITVHNDGSVTITDPASVSPPS